MFSLCQIFKGPLTIFKHKIYSGIKIYLYRSVITRQSINCHQASISYHTDLYTVETLKFVMALFSWYSWVVLTNEFASSTKIIFNRFIVPTGTENRRIHEFTSPQISKHTQSTKIGPQEIKGFHSSSRFPKLASFYVSSTPMIINNSHTTNSITHSLT